jgi:hypothetical protein
MVQFNGDGPLGVVEARVIDWPLVEIALVATLVASVVVGLLVWFGR